MTTCRAPDRSDLVPCQAAVRLARRIATLAPGVASGAVAIVDTALSSHEDGLKAEDEVLFGLFARPAALALTRAARAAGAQTRDGERELETILDGITTASQLEHHRAGAEG